MLLRLCVVTVNPLHLRLRFNVGKKSSGHGRHRQALSQDKAWEKNFHIVDEWKEEGKGGFEGNEEIHGGERRLGG